MKAPRKRSHGNVPLTLLAAASLLASAACDPSTDEAAQAPTATATTEAEAPDLARYCETMCARTSHCGLELAKREAGKADEELVAELEKDQATETKRCVSACSKEPLDEAQRFQMERAQVCLGKTDCDELSACMAAL